MTEEEKIDIKVKLKEVLSKEKEVSKIIVFGSFLKMKNPNDIDIAIFQDSKEVYLKLSMKYRKLTRQIAKIIPLDIVPLKNNSTGIFLSEINNGEIIYER
ncbi:MAG: nucleotidyltransferase domain-containing protein [Draconibacterium sp.]|nr:nucleotidyltransferase domain-containing protein [Draconibacterium sp.]